ncbi:MAG: hypothetical protein JWO31_3782, partial [Phycisphaerales bacterium]|nr:hypothetical protein [Phycisphaerales bacterium]
MDCERVALATDDEATLSHSTVPEVLGIAARWTRGP